MCVCVCVCVCFKHVGRNNNENKFVLSSCKQTASIFIYNIRIWKRLKK